MLVALLILLLSRSERSLYPDENKKSTIVNNFTNFAVNDTASISKIFIADKSGATITLDRMGGNWIVNNKYDVPKIRIATILNAIRQLEFQRYVPKDAFETVVKNLATTGVKVEIYGDKKALIKTYTIGGRSDGKIKVSSRD